MSFSSLLAKWRQRSLMMTDQSLSNCVPKQVSLLSLSPDILDKIIYFLLPISGDCAHDKRLPISILPLALTCKSMYSYVARFVAVKLTNNFLSGLDDFFDYDMYCANLLFRAANIGLRKLSLQSSLDTNDCQSMATTASSFSQRQLIKSKLVCCSLFYGKEGHCTNTICSFEHPFLAGTSHTQDCRFLLAWITIGASSDSLLELHWSMYTSMHQQNIECVMRMCSFLGLSSFRHVSLQEEKNKSSREMEPIYYEFLHSCSQSLLRLSVDMQNESLLKAICTANLSYLESLSLVELFPDEPEKYYRDYGFKIIKSFQSNRTPLKTLFLPDMCFVSKDEEDEVMNLSTLLPQLSSLQISGMAADWKIDNFFSDTGNVERVCILSENPSRGILYSLQEAYCEGLFVNVTEFVVEIAEAFIFTCIRNGEDVAVEDTVQLGSEYCFESRALNEASFPELCKPFIPERNHEYMAENIGNISVLESRCDHLRSVQVLIMNEDIDTLVSDEHGQWYSEVMNERLLLNASVLETIHVSDCCGSVDFGIELLQLMGPMARMFDFALSDEISATGDILIQCKISVKSVLLVLKTVMEFCPNIERLNVFPSFAKCNWNRQEFDLVENEVSRMSSQLAFFNPSSFFGHVSFDHLNCKI